MLTNGRGGISEAEGVGGGGGHDEDDTLLEMVDVVIFCFSCPTCDEQVSNYRRGGGCMQLHWDETVLVKTGSAAAEMEKSSRTYTLQ